MTLSAGTRLGPYEILSPLGAGGMGEVFRARDARLGREVAVKVLPGELAGDPDRLRRFEQEAQSASALNHPHILVVHDFGQQDGRPYLVTELLAGESLRERLNDGPLPARKAIEIAIQVAHGLAAAHERGIVHRDLKPENLFLTSDGVVKILDFGLAKLLRPELSGTQIAGAPTVRGTEPGVVLGTAGYMSPEQVRGLPADQRSDLFSLGAILYELLAGKKAFQRDSAADTMAAILREDPPELAQSGVTIPPALERIVRHCLEKNPSERFRSAHDLGFALASLSASSATGTLPAVAAPSRRRLAERGAWAAIGLLIGALAASAIWLATRARETSAAVGRAPTRFRLLPPPGTTFNSEDGPVAVSPDGRQLVYRLNNPPASPGAPPLHLWVQPLGELEPRAVPGSNDAYDPFWSPDGRSLGFFGEQLSTVDLAGGGPPQLLAPVDDGRGATWSPAGVIVYAPSAFGALFKVPVAGGVPAPATQLGDNAGKKRHLRPEFLPDGRHFLFLEQGVGGQDSNLMVGSLDSFETRRILPLDVPARFAPPAHLLYHRGSSLVAHPFDPQRLEVTGDPVTIAQDVGFVTRYDSPAFTASSALLAFHPAGAAADSQPTWFERDGTPLGDVGAPGDNNLDLSPDGKRLAAQSESDREHIDIWVIDLTRGVRSRLTFEREPEIGPVWSADGTRIFYSLFRTGAVELMVKPAGGGTAEKLLGTPYNLEAVAASPDGRKLIVETDPPGKGTDIEIVDLESRERSPLAATQFDEHSARISTDGRFVAYSSNESGEFEIYVAPFPPSGSKWQISSGGGMSPRWRKDGRQLLFSGHEGKLMAVDVDTTRGFEIGAQQPLFRADTQDYVLVPDGRLIVSTRLRDKPPASIVVVLDWTAGLPAPGR